MRLSLASVGFTSTIAQILLMRELVAVFYGNELLYGLVLMVWLAWVAAGSWGLAKNLLPRYARPQVFASGLILTSLLLLSQIALIRNVRNLLNITPGTFVEFAPMVVTVVLFLAPLCLVGGFLFTLGAHLLTKAGGTAGQAYAWESMGAVFGGVLFSFALIRWLDPFQTALLVAVVNLTVASLLYLSSPAITSLLPRPSITYLLLTCTFILFSLASIPLGHNLHTATLQWQWDDLVYAADSLYGRITVQARNGQRIFYENGLLAFETQGTFPEEVTHFPLLEHPQPQNVLLIGGGIAGDLREILKHPVSKVTYVELDPRLVESAEMHLPPEEVTILKDPRITILPSDGRLFVKSTSQSYDLIILDLPEPSTGALNRFYTLEFFREAHTILKPGGVFSLGLPASENYWSPELARRNASVYHTLRAVFAEVIVLPGEHNFYLASDSPLTTDPQLLVHRLTERGIENRWVTPDYIEYIFKTDRFAQVQGALEAFTGIRYNHDLRPICYYYDLVLWLSLFYPHLRGLFESASLITIWVLGIPLALVAVLIRWQRRWAIHTAIATIGLAQMTLQVVILFAFQVLYGYVYNQVSLIVTAFMAGLALGSATSNRLIPNALQTPTPRRRLRGMFIGVQVTVIFFSLSLAAGLQAPVPAPAVVFPLLAVLAGFLTGMAFPLAIALLPEDAGLAAGRLYATDLAGGCLGALLGTVLLVPILGIPQTCIVVALVALTGLIGIVA
ncbi:MAG: hypothetical protein AB1345_07835 [Chloroflexota bacterium]